MLIEIFRKYWDIEFSISFCVIMIIYIRVVWGVVVFVLCY